MRCHADVSGIRIQFFFNETPAAAVGAAAEAPDMTFSLMTTNAIRAEAVLSSCKILGKKRKEAFRSIPNPSRRRKIVMLVYGETL